MSVFKYKAISLDGGKVSGVVEAYDDLEAIAQIKETCSVVTSITEVRSAPKAGRALFAGGTIDEKALALFCSQFAITLKAGVPIVKALELVLEQTADHRFKELLEKTAQDVAAGYGLAQSFENKGKKLLPTTFIETVRAGEESGTLEVSFAKLQVYYEKSAKIKNTVKSAMMYPCFLLVLAVVVIGIIMVVVMPTFTKMFADMDMELPGLTKALMAAADFFAGYWWLVAFILLALAVAFRCYARTDKGRLKLAQIQLKLPGLGRMNQMKGASQLSGTLSTLLTAGIPLVRAVTITAKVLDNRYLGQRLALLTPQMEEGKPLGTLLGREKFFPSMLCEMIAMGESSGALEETLNTVGVFYDEETKVASERALGMLQPAITVFLGLVIGVIVIALYLPMFTMYNGMG